ncbi:MAG TPA: PLP-dependent aspartate aminotransferase family protein [Gemmatimonadaceae bacterium]|jgi:cystathionine beta-lyase/cystathionine gamma-synthase
MPADEGRKPDLATLAVHAGVEARETNDAVHAERVQRRLAALEGTEAALLLSSGMGAIACAHLALLRPGDHLIASSWISDATAELFTKEFTSLGIEVSLVNPLETRVWRKYMRKETRAVFLETPVHATCRVLDLRPVSYVTKESGLALIVDSTVASSINLRPAEHGADVVIHSATSFLSGRDAAAGGVVCGSSSYVDEVRRKMTLWGQTPDPFGAWLLERDLETLDVRVQRQNRNAMAVAKWGAGQSQIGRVHYSGLPSHPDHQTASETMNGFGGLLGIELVDGTAAERLLRKLKVIRHASTIGGVDSVVCNGSPDGFLRLSLGIESAQDVIGDLEQALH